MTGLYRQFTDSEDAINNHFARGNGPISAHSSKEPNFLQCVASLIARLMVLYIENGNPVSESEGKETLYMKKVFVIFLMLMIIASLSVACAEGAEIANEAVSVSSEPIVANEKASQETTDTKGSSASPDVGDLIRFVPTTIDVTNSSVTVYGYFINMNTDRAVMDFKEFEMDVYMKDNLLISGSFGKIHEFTIEPLRMKYQSFTFDKSHDLSPGSYVCNDTCYCYIGCSFSSSKR